MQKKTDLRHALLASRRAIAPDARSAWDAAIALQLKTRLALQPVHTLGVYWPIRGEPDLRALYAELAADGVRLALPVVVGKDVPLEYVVWTPGDTMVKDAFGVAVPVDREILQPDMLLIPCVGFNAQRIRLGYGGGHYDRTLAAMSPRPVAIGIAYACAQADFAAEPHDIALDAIITEAG